MEHIDLIITANVDGQEIEISITNPADMDEIFDSLRDKYIDEYNEEDDPEDSIITDVVVKDWDDLPDNLRDLETVFEIVSENPDNCLEVISAGIEAGLQISEIDEAYNGEWKSDVDFVQNLVEDCGDIPSDLPSYIHIDWESTARDIMMDYSECNGHYFRN